MNKNDTSGADNNKIEVRYFRHRVTQAIIVVRGGLSHYYALHGIDTNAGIGRDGTIQVKNKNSGKAALSTYLLEVAPEQQLRLLLQTSSIGDYVKDISSQYTGLLRLSKHKQDPLMALVEAGHVSELLYRGRTVEQQGRLTLFIFELLGAASRALPWELISLNLVAQPIDSYTYFAGRRASTSQGQSHGTVSLWQEKGGLGQYYVETAPSHNSAPAFPFLEMLTVEQIREWYDFRFVPAPPTK